MGEPTTPAKIMIPLNSYIASRVNPVEGLYQTFPFFLVLNATYCGWLLQPVLEFADSNLWSLPYAPRDIGAPFRPNSREGYPVRCYMRQG